MTYSMQNDTQQAPIDVYDGQTNALDTPTDRPSDAVGSSQPSDKLVFTEFAQLVAIQSWCPSLFWC